jgi:peptidyl-tRNA hydrolase, PTH1 family
VAFLSSLIASLLGKNPPVGVAEKVFFGIGNPGRQYRDTRHNAGFLAIDKFASAASSREAYRKASWEAIYCKREGLSAALVKPMTYVNRCGEALVDIIKRTGCPLSSCLVIVDDYHLPLGKIRMRPGGSDGGHNGLKSIIAAVGTQFPRLRIGIGPIPEGMDSVQFVLGEFGQVETAAVQSALTKADEAMLLFARQGIEKAMNEYNK